MKHALSVSSDFSIGKSILHIDKLVATAKDFGYSSVALVDNMSIHGLVEFFNCAKQKEIKAIIGCRLNVYDSSTYKKPTKSSGKVEQQNNFYQLKVYVKSELGLKSLFKLLTDANSKEQFYYHARTDLKSVLSLKDVIVTTGDMYNMFTHKRYMDIAKVLKKRFKDDFYIELCPIDTPLFDRLNEMAFKTCIELESKPLLTYPFYYKDVEDAPTLDLMTAIATNTQMSLNHRPKQFVNDFAFFEPKEIVSRAGQALTRLQKYFDLHDTSIWKDAIRGIDEVASKCTYEFSQQDVSLPTFSDNEFKLLCDKCLIGWNKRLKTEVLGYKPTEEDLNTVYKERLAYELKILKKMKFESYFLLVEDLVKWSKQNNVMCGPGRGSVGGSLVAYLLEITDVDPIRFGLIFERFINPERLDLPDADLDFSSENRYKVIDYLTEKYGKEYVAGISNYSTLALASSLRDSGRISGLNGLQLTPTKLIPKTATTLEEASLAEPELEKFKLEHPEIWGHAEKLVGTMKSFGQHAAGIIVAGEPIVNRAVVETRGESPVVNWDKRCVEHFGLVKMDLLGLSTLDTLNIAKQYIKERHGIEIDYLKIPLEDENVMEALGRGETSGVFQLESSGMRKLLKDLRKGGKLTFKDISACTALYRPGPMESGMLNDYVEVRQGYRGVHYEHPSMEEALKETMGVVVYQEQVMKIAVDFAGFSNAEADFLRKAMGKKDPVAMSKVRDKFVQGAVETSKVDESFAGAIFDKIEAFAGYGFNKSHSVAYSIISVWCAYIRVYYPAEYFSASLSIVAEDKIAELVKSAKECGIEIQPPNINLSTDKYIIKDDNTIVSPFNVVKGVSDITARAIVKLRKSHRELVVTRHKKNAERTPVYGYEPSMPIKGRFDSFDEFKVASEMKGTKINSRVVESLRAVGAFADVEDTNIPAMHPSRRKDQVMLMPNIISEYVKADRETDLTDSHLKSRLIEVVQDYKVCENCTLKGRPHPTIRHGKHIKFMIVTDCPTSDEERKDALLNGDVADVLKTAMKNAGLNPSNGYYTTLVKSKKTDKFLTNEQINGCKGFLSKEIEVIKPSVIIALGSASIKHFIPTHKGSTAELVGNVVYNPELDANIVCGFNPLQIVFNAEKLKELNDIFSKVSEILS